MAVCVCISFRWMLATRYGSIDVGQTWMAPLTIAIDTLEPFLLLAESINADAQPCLRLGRSSHTSNSGLLALAQRTLVVVRPAALWNGMVYPSIYLWQSRIDCPSVASRQLNIYDVVAEHLIRAIRLSTTERVWRTQIMFLEWPHRAAECGCRNQFEVSHRITFLWRRWTSYILNTGENGWFIAIIDFNHSGPVQQYQILKSYINLQYIVNILFSIFTIFT